MAATKIEWCDDVWNPLKGCTNNCFDGLCYANEIAKRGLSKCPRCNDFSDVHTHRERLLEPRSWKAPKLAFLGSCSDLWCDAFLQEDGYPPHDRRAVRCDAFAEVGLAATAGHQFVVLTQRPEHIRLHEEVIGPGRLRNPEWDGGNLWLGVTVRTAEEWTRLHTLTSKLADFEQTWREFGALFNPWRCRTVASWEPMMEPLELPPFRKLDGNGVGLDWLIMGVATGRLAREQGLPDKRLLGPLVADAVNHCLDRGTRVFLKDALLDYLGWDRSVMLENSTLRWTPRALDSPRLPGV